MKMVNLQLAKFQTTFLVFLLLPITSHRPIIDTPLANLSDAQKNWLLDDRESAKDLYIEEINKVEEKEIPTYNVAYLYYLEGKNLEADHYVQLSLKHNHKYGPSLLLKGIIEYDRRNIRNSYYYLKSAIKYHSNPEIPEYIYGSYLYERGNYKKALEILNDAISDNKKFTLPYPIISEIYLKFNEHDKALKILEKGLKYSYDAEILLSLAKVNEILKNDKEAEKLYMFFEYFFPNHTEAPDAIKWLSKRNIKNSPTNPFTPPPKRDFSDRFFPVGEDMLYSVYWGPIRVGELHTVIEDTLSFMGHDAYRVIFSLDSNPALEFIASLHSDYITFIDQETKQAIRHYLHLRENKIINEKVYDFYRAEGKFICRTVQKDGHIEYLEKYLPKYTIDATSLLFYSRQVVKEAKNETIMTIIDENFVISDIVYENKKEPVSYHGKEESGILISGENHYKGIVGFTGRFHGWFRDGPTYLPLRADFEIWVGRISIKIASEEEQRLHKYSR